MPYRPHRGAQILFIVFACYSLESLSSVQRLEKEKKTSYTQQNGWENTNLSSSEAYGSFLPYKVYVTYTTEMC